MICFNRITIMLCITILYGYSSNLYAQEAIKKKGNDGFEWYKCKSDNKYGAKDSNGIIIVPIEFSSVNYYDGIFKVVDRSEGFVKEGIFLKDAFQRPVWNSA